MKTFQYLMEVKHLGLKLEMETVAVTADLMTVQMIEGGMKLMKQTSQT